MIEILKARAELYTRIREYFSSAGVLEVSTPALSFSGNPDPAIESFRSDYQFAGSTRAMYLHTSPEFFMKRLLAGGSGSIFQIARVFRQSEQGRFHNPEFTMLEWYRLGYDYRQLIEDVISLVSTVTQAELVTEYVSYREAFAPFGIDPWTPDRQQLQAIATDHDLNVHQPDSLSCTDWLNLFMTHIIEPGFDQQRLTVVYDYPKEQASLAKISEENPGVAERFEVFWRGVELANGFTELRDATEQRKRFDKDNATRQKQGLDSVPLDRAFLESLQFQGLPACSGVALGLDRLLMIMTESETIQDVMAFPISAV